MVKRRDVLKSITGLAGISTLAGCVDPNNPSELISGGSQKPSFGQTVKDVTLKKTPPEYGNGKSRTIILSKSLASSLGVGSYEQVRVRTKSNPEIKWQQRASLFTTRFDADFDTDKEENIAWMTEDGLKRQGLGIKENTVDITPFATNPNIESRNEADRLKDIMEQSVQNTNNETLLACSPHGGDILRNSELQALLFSQEEEFNSWMAAGFEYTDEEAYKRFYVDPALLNPNSFYLLDKINDEYDYAISFVLLDDESRSSEITIGGLAELDIKRVYAAQLSDKLPSQYNVRIDTNGPYDGTETRNFVNRITKNGVNGIQIAQTKDITRTSWRTVAEACLEAHKKYIKDD